MYGEDGSFLSGTYADYLVGTAHEIPRFLSLQARKPTPSPWTAFGAKGISEGNTTSTPVCIANAVADALERSDITLPLRPSRVAEWIHAAEVAPRQSLACEQRASTVLTGDGSIVLPASPERIFAMLLDPAVLARIIPGCHELSTIGANAYRANVSLGMGPVCGRFDAQVAFTELSPPYSTILKGRLAGSLGAATGCGHIRLSRLAQGTRAEYGYEIAVSGKAAAVGARMLDGAARSLVALFFRQLASASGGVPQRSWWHSLLSRRTSRIGG